MKKINRSSEVHKNSVACIGKAMYAHMTSVSYSYDTVRAVVMT